MTATIEEELCSGCGICVDACLEQALSVHHVAAVDPSRCIGCGACIAECPNGAISLGWSVPAAARGAAG